jgi:hypothetical protein
VASRLLKPLAGFRSRSRAGGCMADIVFIVVTIVFFAVAWLFAVGCDRL